MSQVAGMYIKEELFADYLQCYFLRYLSLQSMLLVPILDSRSEIYSLQWSECQYKKQTSIAVL